MAKKALIVWGGWDGHSPKPCAELFEKQLTQRGYEVTLSNTLDSFTDKALLSSVDLIVPIWTMGQISGEQEKGVGEAVAAGVGLAGFHGGMCDAFRSACLWQFITGGQFVAHPGGNLPEWNVEIADRFSPITQGIGSFTLKNTERYYMHVDPSNHVLADAAMPRVFAQTDIYGGSGTAAEGSGYFRMPVAWQRTWGKGKVFFASWGHKIEDFSVPEALEITARGMVWATR